MTKITKHNVREQIESHLKSLKIRYNIVDQNDSIYLYEIFVSSLPTFIQVEHDLKNDDDDEVCIQFFTETDDTGTSLYSSILHSVDNIATVEEEIYELIEASKRFNKIVSKIYKNIETIKEICDEYELNYEYFIRRDSSN